MKKLWYVYAALVAALLVFIQTRFGHFVIDGSSLWQQAGWIRLVPFTYGFVIFGIATLAEWNKGGFGGWVGLPAKWVEDDKRFPIYKASFFWFTVICLVFESIIFFWSLSDK